MSSIIEYFNKNGLNYTSVGSTHEEAENPYNAFKKGDEYGFCSSESNNYWIVSFEKPVTVESYIISSGTGWDWWITSWEISYSMKGESFTPIQTDKIDDLRGNTKKFPFSSPVYCKQLKIVMKSTSDGGIALFFNSFDCFGSVGALKKTYSQCTSDCRRAKSQLVTWIMMTIFPSSLSS